MPTDAVVPSTPLSLLPFLNKVNEQWSSDLETPQAESHTKPVTSSTERVTHFFYKLCYTIAAHYRIIKKVSFIINISDGRNT